MPLTFPAHQAPAIALKIVRPDRFDGTALCVGAAVPDLAYPFGSWLAYQSHAAIGLVVWAVPLTLLICGVLRWRAAAGIFALLPDAGPLRLRSLRVIGTRRPRPLVTLWSGALGAASHIVIDAFTHTSRWGAQWLGIGETINEWPIRGEFSVATALQDAGHIAGSLAAILLLVYVARRRLLEEWYGAELVEAVRGIEVRRRDRLQFWSVVAATLGIPIAAALLLGRDPLFIGVAMTVAGLLVAGSLVGEALPRDPGRQASRLGSLVGVDSGDVRTRSITRRRSGAR